MTIRLIDVGTKNGKLQRRWAFEITSDDLAPNFNKGEWYLGDREVAAKQNNDIVLMYGDGSLLLIPSGTSIPNSPEPQYTFVLTHKYESVINDPDR